MNQWVKGHDKPVVSSLWLFPIVALLTNVSKIKPFLDIYDATSKYRQKKFMNMVKHSDIGFGDVILVECALTRYKVGEKKTEPGWEEWKTGFDLLSIALLASAPDGTAIPSISTTKDTADLSL